MMGPLLRTPTWAEFVAELVSLVTAVPLFVYITAAVILAAAVGQTFGTPDPATDPAPWQD